MYLKIFSEIFPNAVSSAESCAVYFYSSLPLLPFPNFLLASSLCIIRSLKKLSLDQGCVLQDDVQITKRRQSQPSASQIYTEKLQKRGGISPSLYQRSYQSQVMQFVRALKTEPQAEFHHHVKWTLPFLNSINSFASTFNLTAWLGSLSTLHLLKIEQTTEAQDAHHLNMRNSFTVRVTEH